jgi:hypothetical protein
VRLKALVVVGDGLEDYGDLLAVGRAEAKRMLRTHENVNVKDILYSAKYGCIHAFKHLSGVQFHEVC